MDGSCCGLAVGYTSAHAHAYQGFWEKELLKESSARKKVELEDGTAAAKRALAIRDKLYATRARVCVHGMFAVSLELICFDVNGCYQR